MKLRNKKTGEIIDLTTKRLNINSGRGNYGFNSLAELNEEWEDYEEPKENWTIDPINEDCIDDGRYTTPDELERYEELGLKFNTKEEAEKAIEKLKAWKRLKDKGFEVDLWDYDGGNYQERIKTGRILFRIKDYEENDKDLDLLFS